MTLFSTLLHKVQPFMDRVKYPSYIKEEGGNKIIGAKCAFPNLKLKSEALKKVSDEIENKKIFLVLEDIVDTNSFTLKLKS